MGIELNKVIIGLTGGIGSGKTTVSDMFAQKGIDIVDADLVARKVVDKGSVALTTITERFGNKILLDSKELDRSQLRTIVFNDSSEKEWLNQLLHPLIREEMLVQISKTTSNYCILVAPLLLENGLDSFVSKVLVVDVDEATQIERTSQRDSSNKDEIKRIIASQIPRNERLAKADDIINNTSSNLKDLRLQVDLLHKTYLKLGI